MGKNRALGIALAVALALMAWWLSRDTSNSSAHSSASIASEPASSASVPTRESSPAVDDARQDPELDRSSEVVEAPAEVRPAASDASPVESFDARLDRTCATFLTESPDVAALVRLWDEVARDAQLELGSLQRDAGSLSGRLVLPNSKLPASFQIVNGSYRVSLDTNSTEMDGGNFVMRSVTLAFRDDGGLAAAGTTSVKFHPDTRKSASAELANEPERLLGWSVGMHEGGMKATPITARVAESGTGWIVGRSTTRPKTDVTSGVDGKAEQRLMDRIGAVKDR